MLLANGTEQFKHAPVGWQKVPNAFKHAHTRNQGSAPLGYTNAGTARAYVRRYVSDALTQARPPGRPEFPKARGEEVVAWQENGCVKMTRGAKG